MKKSSKVSLTFLSSFAAALMTGCGGDSGDWVEAKRCIDNNNVVVEDRLCDEKSGARSGAHGGHYFYYGGRGYYPGDIATGGGRVPQGGVRYASPSHIPRGGFGATGRAFVGRSGSSIGS
jgi:hypothetical protein